MAYFLSPLGPVPQFFDDQGNVLANGKLYFFLQNTTTPEDTFTDSTGQTANAHPIELLSTGRPPYGIYLTEDVGYKLRVFDSDDNLVDEQDVIFGIPNQVTNEEWVSSGLTPTYLSASTLSFPGDQTTDAHKRRRVKVSDAGGTKYGTITASAFTTLTTVTVEVDGGGSLANPITSVSFSVLRADNPSVDADMVHRKSTDAVASAATTDIWSIQGDYVHISGSTGPITSFGTAPYAGASRTLIFDSTPIITNGSSLQCPGGRDIPIQAGDVVTVRADTTANHIITSHTRALVNPVLLEIAQQGRPTLTTATPVTTNDVTGATTVYFTPMAARFTEVSQTTTDNTKSPAAVANNSNYDMFLWMNGGTLRCTRGPAWSSDTSRGTGAGTSELASVNGIRVNAVAITNGPAAQAGIYVGTIRSDGSAQINDSKATRGVWNLFNRVDRFCSAGFSANRSTSSTTWTEINTEIRNQFVLGLAEDCITAFLNGTTQNDTLGSISFSAVSLDSTTIPIDTMTGAQAYTGTASSPVGIGVATNPSIGFHFTTALGCVNANTGTWSGAAFPGTSTRASRCVLSTRLRA